MTLTQSLIPSKRSRTTTSPRSASKPRSTRRERLRIREEMDSSVTNLDTEMDAVSQPIDLSADQVTRAINMEMSPRDPPAPVRVLPGLQKSEILKFSETNTKSEVLAILEQMSIYTPECRDQMSILSHGENTPQSRQTSV